MSIRVWRRQICRRGLWPELSWSYTETENQVRGSGKTLLLLGQGGLKFGHKTPTCSLTKDSEETPLLSSRLRMLPAV